MSQTPQAQDGKPKKKSRFKFYMILFALLLLIGGGALGAYWFFTKGDVSPMNFISSLLSSDEEKPANTNSAITNEETGTTTTSSTTSRGNPTTLVSLPVLTINLADTGVTRYLRIGIDVEVSTSSAADQINNQSSRIRDAIIILLSSKTYANLSTSDGKFILKNEITARINQVLGEPRVVQIYFTDFVVQ